MTDYLQTTISAENSGAVHALDNFLDATNKDDVVAVLSRDVYQADGTKRIAALRAIVMRETGYRLRVLAPDGSEIG